MARLVMKFGGTSVGSAEAIHQAAQIICATQQDWPQLVVVVSAMSGTTDALLRGARSAAAGDGKLYAILSSELRDRHYRAIDGLLNTPREIDKVRDRVETHLAEFEVLCHAVNVLGEASNRVLDAISSLGERISTHLVAAHLREMGCVAAAVRATELIRTDDIFQDANPDMAVSRELIQARLTPLLKQGVIPIVTGFIGTTAAGAVTTLGRGGSDYTAGILGAALDASEVWIWTDVDGIMSADPRIVSRARTLPEVGYREISELAYFGAKVLHPKTIRPVIEKNIRLRIKNTFAPDKPGTLVVAEPSNGGAIKAVTAIKGQSLITVEGHGMIGVQGIAARTFTAVMRAKASATMITQASSEQSICFSVANEATGHVLAALEDEFRLELQRRDIDRLWALPDVVIVTVVGAGMQHTPGISGRVFSALGNEGLNVIAIAQGSSECSISLVVNDDDADASVRAIHELILDEKNLAAEVHT